MESASGQIHDWNCGSTRAVHGASPARPGYGGFTVVSVKTREVAAEAWVNMNASQDVVRIVLLQVPGCRSLARFERCFGES